MANYISSHSGAQIDSAVSAALAMGDYVVDTGTSGIWSYRKWNSGIAECWLTAGYMTSAVPATMTANGQLYESNTMTVALPSGLFSATPNVTIDTQQGGGMWFKCTGETSNTTVVYEMLRTNNTKAAAKLSIQCKGRWN